MDINKSLIQTIEDSVYNKGMFIEIGHTGSKFDMVEEIGKGNIKTSIHKDYLDSYLFLLAFSKMLKDEVIDIRFNNKATDFDMEYLKRLSEGFKENV